MLLPKNILPGPAKMSDYRLRITDQYRRKERRFLRKHPDLTQQYHKTLVLLQTSPHHPSLRMHKLKGPLQEFHSVSINIKYRITIEFIIRDKLIIPVTIGSHDEVY